MSRSQLIIASSESSADQSFILDIFPRNARNGFYGNITRTVALVTKAAPRLLAPLPKPLEI